jgi:ligand-binding SRPBCC domain-containing protein
VIIRRFDGIKTGNLIILDLNFLLFRWHWSGIISSFEENSQELIFVDEGKILPPFLSSWRHRHVIKKVNDGTKILDEIEFRPAKGWPEWLVRGMIWLQMMPRNRIYKAYFKA